MGDNLKERREAKREAKRKKEKKIERTIFNKMREASARRANKTVRKT